MNIFERITKLEQIVRGLAARTFMYYAKGTYAPTYQGGTTGGVTTYVIQTGTWTQIGNIVIARIVLVWSAATGTGTAQFSLPFPAGSSGSGPARFVNITFASGSPGVNLASGDSFFTLLSPASNAAGTAVAMEGAGNLVATIVYGV